MSGRGFGSQRSPDAAGEMYSPEYSAEMLRQQFALVGATVMGTVSEDGGDSTPCNLYRCAAPQLGPAGRPMQSLARQAGRRSEPQPPTARGRRRNINVVAGRWPPRCTAVRRGAGPAHQRSQMGTSPLEPAARGTAGATPRLSSVASHVIISSPARRRLSTRSSTSPGPARRRIITGR